MFLNKYTPGWWERWSSLDCRFDEAIISGQSLGKKTDRIILNIVWRGKVAGNPEAATQADG